jgi:uncharacterized protein (DUF924 family)
MASARTAVLEILHAIEALDVDRGAKQKFRDAVNVIASTYGFDWMERANRITFARQLLGMRVPRPLVRDRLIALYGISRPQAYRVISYALQPDHLPRLG